MGTLSGSVNIQKVQDDVLKLWSVVKALQPEEPRLSPYMKVSFVLYTTILTPILILPTAPPSSFDTGVTGVTSLSSDKTPLLHLKRKVGNTWEYSSNVYLDILHEIATSGTTFKDKNAFNTMRDGSIFSYHQVDPSKFWLEHGKSYLFSVIPILISFVPPPFNL